MCNNVKSTCVGRLQLKDLAVIDIRVCLVSCTGSLINFHQGKDVMIIEIINCACLTERSRGKQ